MPTTSSASPCQAPSPAGLGLPLLTSPGARASTLAFGRRRLRLRGDATAAPTGHLFLGLPKPRFSSIAAVGDVAAVSDDYIESSPSSSGYPNSSMGSSSHEDNQSKRVVKMNKKSGDKNKMIKVCDKLIGVFMVDKPTPTGWRKLLAFSREWDNIRPHFFKRCQERADAELNPEMKHKLLRLGRKLKEIDEDVQRHNELLEVVKSTPSDKIGAIVAKRRKDFTVEFFNHLYYVAESYHDEPEKQTELAKLGNDCVDALQAHDDTTGSLETLNAAELKLKDILNSPSVDAACRKIDDLAEKKELDSALVLMLSKAWSAAKGTDITKSEAKDIMFHLYMTAVANLQRQMPKDIRILKHLIMIEDPEERLSAMNDAFTPGPELQGDNVDTLYTPEALQHQTLGPGMESSQGRLLLNRLLCDGKKARATSAVAKSKGFIHTSKRLCYSSREATLVVQERDLMNPKIIKRVKEMEKTIKDKHL
ncbi:Uncharacterized protein BAE44_0009806 [Dichanthelium oligosanthes]|uniref:Uncharacterized protein n=1 Tax=Dichanthelium oligosanthes TaxID=888268 RepID=A0A1E5VVN0_9POAL|nr:Uncharacterized protein BAE44_0009806 [Dichanthelium oligosanthes]